MAEIISLALHQPPRLLLTFFFVTSSPLLHKGGEFRITFNNFEQRVLLLIQGEHRRGPELTTKNTETKYIHPKSHPHKRRAEALATLCTRFLKNPPLKRDLESPHQYSNPLLFPKNPLCPLWFIPFVFCAFVAIIKCPSFTRPDPGEVISKSSIVSGNCFVIPVFGIPRKWRY